MKLEEFRYKIPEHLIAQQPLKERANARLMVVDRKSKSIVHDVFSNINKYLPSQSLIVLNDSKVVPARLLGRRKSGGQVEVFLLKKLSDGCSFETLIRPLKRIKIGEEIIFNGSSLSAQVVDKEKRIVKFDTKNIQQHLGRIGHMPLPPYIKRADTIADRKYYQTVYAKKEGSVAAPTAGLHFTKPLLTKLKNEKHSLAKVTLHVNYATFKPVEEKNIVDHEMHKEEYSISKKTLQTIKEAKGQDRKVIAVGTTSCRVLETIASSKKLRGTTDLFIYPGFRFKMVDGLITNFHLPCSTLLMLVYAFGSKSLVKKAYQEAIKEKYRFYSYGDAMLII